MKQFTVVFPVANVNGVDHILLGEQPVGRPLAGYLNGYGGKVEDIDGEPTDELANLGLDSSPVGSRILKAAERELYEELGTKLNNPKYIGKVEHGQKEVFFFLSISEFVSYKDSLEMINNNWYDLKKDDFVGRMLPGDMGIIEYIRKNIQAYFKNESIPEFKMKKIGQSIDSAVTELDKSIKLR